jgi:hypothetical protein
MPGTLLSQFSDFPSIVLLTPISGGMGQPFPNYPSVGAAYFTAGAGVTLLT